MKIEQLLRKYPQSPITGKLADGTDIHEYVKNRLPAKDQYELPITGEEIMTLLHNLSRKERAVILRAELDVDTEDNIERDVYAIISEVRGAQSKLRSFTVITMVVLITAIILSYCYVMVDVSLANKTIPDWQGIALVIVIPGMILWQNNGVLSKENRDLLTGILGHIKNNGPLGTLKDIFTKGSGSSTADSTANRDGSTSSGQKTSQKPVDDDLDDNPPPGAAR